MKLYALLVLLIATLAAGCKKDKPAPSEKPASPPEPAAASPAAAPPGPAPRPVNPVAIPPPENGDPNATLAVLTRELHRSMIGAKHLPASFEEFAAARNVNVPPPPPGKKYAISKQWRVVLVDR
jgi:hypothetical protein